MNDIVKPNIIVSKCLLGEKCRYNGGCKKNEFVLSLCCFANIIGVCPEVAIGLGVPRDTIRLAFIDGEYRILSNNDDSDYTDRMNVYFDEFLDGKQVDGAILKAKSPSCGYGDTDLFDQNYNLITKNSDGFFTKRMLDDYPSAVLKNDKKLNSKVAVEKFYTEVLLKAEFAKE